MDIARLIRRDTDLFLDDLAKLDEQLSEVVSGAKILIVGAAGSIGQAVTMELLNRHPKALHAVDISENNLVELVRFVRSSVGYISGDFRTFAIDCASLEFDFFCSAEGPYDYVLNFSALKHVRSEKDPYTLMRMVEVNINNALKILKVAKLHNAKNYFCISTDKASNPVNMMGASKKIMEKLLISESLNQKITMARFANVAFSDGSLLYGFNKRLENRQPISAPNDIKRYFISPKEAGQLCMLSSIFGNHNEIFFPKLDSQYDMETFSNIAINFLELNGFEAVECESEEEARLRAEDLINSKKWPVYFFKSDTTGEKYYEEFYTEDETLDLNRFNSIGIVKNAVEVDIDLLKKFQFDIKHMRTHGSWTKQNLVELFKMILPEFRHEEKGKYLDDRM
ncbi:UDP-N-acetylglucosamine 4,6-dehydratase [Amylibacter sp.]|nr:UDP-N-acetylglucosamine 4,6-dehydratase [Amylibacter sp.]